jgi:hypothetical protein
MIATFATPASQQFYYAYALTGNKNKFNISPETSKIKT